MINFILSKSFHLMEYGVLFLVTHYALDHSVSLPQKITIESRTLLVSTFRFAFILVILYAVTDEVHQLFVPTRHGTPRDVIIDGIGAYLGYQFRIWWSMM